MVIPSPLLHVVVRQRHVPQGASPLKAAPIIGQKPHERVSVRRRAAPTGCYRHKNRCLRTTLLAPAQAVISPRRTSPRRRGPTGCYRHKNRCLRTTLLVPAQAVISPRRTSPRRRGPTGCYRHKNRCLRTTLLAPAQAVISPRRTSPRRRSATGCYDALMNRILVVEGDAEHRRQLCRFLIDGGFRRRGGNLLRRRGTSELVRSRCCGCRHRDVLGTRARSNRSCRRCARRGRGRRCHHRRRRRQHSLPAPPTTSHGPTPPTPSWPQCTRR